MPCPGEALSKYGESDSAWRQNCPKALSLSGRKIEAGEGAVTLGRNCCQVTAESGVFDCTATLGTVSTPMGVSFRPVFISAVSKRIAKWAELLSFSVNCSPTKETDSNLPRKSIFPEKLIANCHKMIAARSVSRKHKSPPLLRESTKAVGTTGELRERKFEAVQGKIKPSGEGESPCKHRANVHLRRSQGRKPLTPMPPSGGRLRGHGPQKGNVVDTWRSITSCSPSKAPGYNRQNTSACALSLNEANFA